MAEGMEDRRFRDFCAGRHCAHEALRGLGVPARAILRSENGAPLWPEGVIGSISHCPGLAAACAARASADGVASVGLDVERIGRVGRDLWPVLFGAGERAMLDGLPVNAVAAYATAIFSIKECVLKIVTEREMAGLDLPEIMVAVAGNSFGVSVRGVNLPRLSVRVEFLGGHVMAYVTR
ncbi:MAG TPA: 4'-phosphopantetheinyl transferase superfamily protein [Skermanella sp.]|nr:4'-phosphopantetheinyl transferase superfamily protein [Skermanella sp.]